MARAYTALSKRKDFDMLFRKGRMVSTPFFVMRIIPSQEEKPLFAVVVSTKVAKRAVVRNKVKRRIRSIMLPFWPKIAKGTKLAIVVKKPILEIGFKEIAAAIESALKRLNVIS